MQRETIFYGIWISSYFSSQFIKLNYSREKLFFVSEEADFVFKLPKYLQGDIWFWSCSDTIHKAIRYLVFGSRYVVVGICPQSLGNLVFGIWLLAILLILCPRSDMANFMLLDRPWQQGAPDQRVSHSFSFFETFFYLKIHFYLNLQNISFSTTDFCQK